MSDYESVEEIRILANKLYNADLKKTTYKYDYFDLIDNNNKIIIEVKHRSILSNQYPTTIIGYNKYIKGIEYRKKGYRVFYFFKYADGVFYYEYTNQIYEPKRGGLCNKSKNEVQNYIYINIKDLIKIDG